MYVIAPVVCKYAHVRGREPHIFFNAVPGHVLCVWWGARSPRISGLVRRCLLNWWAYGVCCARYRSPVLGIIGGVKWNYSAIIPYDRIQTTAQNSHSHYFTLSCWVTVCIHSGITPVGQLSRKCPKSINQAQTIIITFIITLTWLVYWIRTARSVFPGAGLKWLNTTGWNSRKVRRKRGKRRPSSNTATQI